MPSSAFSAAELAVYADHIQLPARFRPEAAPPCDYALLHALQVHQLATIPYENLLLHYSAARTVALEPPALFAKMVTGGRGRGGYCMENCIFFSHVLRAFGFDAYTTGARIRLRQDGRPHGDFIGWSHIVNIVTLADGQRYVVDVSFGGDGPTRPLPLVAEAISPNLGTQELRLVWASLPGQVSAHSQSWIYQYRNRADQPWNSYYSFNDVEWLAADFRAPNFYVSRHELSFQRHTMFVVKFVREGERIVGKRMLADGVVKENMGGRTVVLRECATEAERVLALREFFGIELTDDERESIRGYPTALSMT